MKFKCFLISFILLIIVFLPFRDAYSITRIYNKDVKTIFKEVRSTLRSLGVRISSADLESGFITTKKSKCKGVKMSISQGIGCMSEYNIEIVPSSDQTEVVVTIAFYHQSWSGGGWTQADDDRPSVMKMEKKVVSKFYSELEKKLGVASQNDGNNKYSSVQKQLIKSTKSKQITNGITAKNQISAQETSFEIKQWSEYLQEWLDNKKFGALDWRNPKRGLFLGLHDKLKSSGESNMISDLEPLLTNEDPWIRYYTLDLILSCGYTNTSMLQQLANDEESSKVSRLASKALESIRGDEVVNGDNNNVDTDSITNKRISTNGKSVDIEERLIKLKNLKAKGLISDKEYKEKKEQILDAL